MRKRPSIQAKLQQDQPPADAHAAPETQPSTPAASSDSPSRAGKVNVSAYLPPEVKASLRLVQAKRGGKVQDLLAEALNLLFAKYGVPEAAPLQQD